MKHINLPSTQALSVSNSYFLWLHGLTLPPSWFIAIYSLVLCYWMKGWLILLDSFMLFSNSVNQLTKMWVLKLTPLQMLKYLIIFVTSSFHLWFIFQLSDLHQSNSFHLQSGFNQTVAFTSQKIRSLFANERTSLVSTALKFSMLRARKIILL